MIRLRMGSLIVAVGLATGCSSTGRVVVQDGYRGIVPAPADYEPTRPGALALAPDRETRPAPITSPAPLGAR